MKKILLIEDDPSITDIYTIGLTAAGYEVKSEALGKKAVELIQGGYIPDLILLDLILPDINGIEVLKQIRKDKKAKDVSVFIFSNYTDGQLEKMGLALKSEKHLLKADITPSRLVEIVKEKLGE